MLFNSFEFAVFLPLVFILYWALKRSVFAQNILILVSSFIFYAWWDWRFLVLIIFTPGVDFLVGFFLEKTDNRTKRLLLLLTSLVLNFTLLGFFKYYNFFVGSFAAAFSRIGINLNPMTLNIILPLGISFYTFHSLSYTIDIYRRNIKASKDVIAFYCFVTFFPQLVAGPIARASNLLPQFENERFLDVDKAKDGLRQMLWGLFKKVVVADTLAGSVNYIFDKYETLPASMLILGAVYFAFQIYCDFSGYTDIALGTARLFGFSLMRNFNFPYFSRDIAEFWRRWHISLSTWFRDYLYIPLGGSRGGLAFSIKNIIIVFVLSGLWHGANWTFIVWGALNAVYFIPLMLFNINRNNLDIAGQDRILPGIKESAQILLTFTLTCFAWIFFRAASLSVALKYIGRIFSPSIIYMPFRLEGLWLIAVIIVMEWIHRKKQHGLQIDYIKFRFIRWAVYYAVIFMIIILGSAKQNFIYFQF